MGSNRFTTGWNSVFNRGRRKGKQRRDSRRGFESLETRTLLSATPELVKDFNTTPVSSDPKELVRIGKTTYFVADDGIHGRELWKTDGTASGTQLVKDILPGVEMAPNTGTVQPDSSNPRSLTALNGKLLFIAENAQFGFAIWKSDGTAAGTTMVRSFLNTFDSDHFTILKNEAYFVLSDSLWKTDGTAKGTVNVGGGGFSLQPELGVFKGQVYFGIRNQLWRTNATSNEVKLVKTLSSPPNDLDANPHFFTVVGNQLYFAASGSNGVQIYRTDGTATGTKRVSNVAFSTPDHRFPITGLATINGKLIFAANDGVNGDELWISNGTTSGTKLLKDINPGSTLIVNDIIPDSSFASDFTVVGRNLYFTADDGEHGRELWVTDGTGAGTKLVKDIALGPASAKIEDVRNVQGVLFFQADDGVHKELWRSNASNSKVVRVSDFKGRSLTPVGGLSLSPIAESSFVYAGYGPAGDQEIWKSNGTASGTKLLKNVRPGTASSDIGELFAFGDRVVFVSNTFTNQTIPNLWISDGSEAGTSLLKENAGIAANDFRFQPEVVGDSLYFIRGSELWKTDGTAAGTKSVVMASEISGLASLGNNAYFIDGPFATLRRTDGSTTSVVKSVPVSTLLGVVQSGGRLYFAVRVDNKAQLWTSNGTPEGTTLVKQFDSAIAEQTLVDVNGSLFFQVGSQLWKSNGTPESTVLVKQLKLGAFDALVSLPDRPFRAAGDFLYYAMYDFDAQQYQLWKSDGTPDGTVVVKAFQASGYGIDDITPAGDRVFFRGDNGIGPELWVTDGTPDGTQLVKDISPTRRGSFATDLTAVNGNVFFVADDEVHGRELWQSDGTPEGTKLVADLHAGPEWSAPDSLVNVNGTLFFTADDGIHGRELWKLEVATASGVNGSVTLQGGTLAIGANQSNAGGLTKTGAGSLTLPTTIQSGTLVGGSISTGSATLQVSPTASRTSQSNSAPGGIVLGSLVDEALRTSNLTDRYSANWSDPSATDEYLDLDAI
jgi:ELWxxDGT repeat protein